MYIGMYYVGVCVVCVRACVCMCSLFSSNACRYLYNTMSLWLGGQSQEQHYTN